jgi:hypothetical protein
VVWAAGGRGADERLRAAVLDHRGLRQDLLVARAELRSALVNNERRELAVSAARVAELRELLASVAVGYWKAVGPAVRAAVGAGLPMWRITERTALNVGAMLPGPGAGDRDGPVGAGAVGGAGAAVVRAVRWLVERVMAGLLWLRGAWARAPPWLRVVVVVVLVVVLGAPASVTPFALALGALGLSTFVHFGGPWAVFDHVATPRALAVLAAVLAAVPLIVVTVLQVRVLGPPLWLVDLILAVRAALAGAVGYVMNLAHTWWLRAPLIVQVAVGWVRMLGGRAAHAVTWMWAHRWGRLVVGVAVVTVVVVLFALPASAASGAPIIGLAAGLIPISGLGDGGHGRGSGWLVSRNGTPRRLDADREVAVEIGGLSVTFWYDHERHAWFVSAPPGVLVNGSDASSAWMLRPGDVISADTGTSGQVTFWTDHPAQPVNPVVAAVELRFRLRQMWLLTRWLDVDRLPSSDQPAGSRERERWWRLRVEAVRLLAEAGNVDEARQRFVELDDPRAAGLAAEALVRATLAGSAGVAAVETLMTAMPSPHHAESIAAAMAKVLSGRGDADGAAAWAVRAGARTSELRTAEEGLAQPDARDDGLDGFAGRPLEEQVYALARRGLVDHAYRLAGPADNPYRKTPWHLIELSIAEGVAARARDLIAAGDHTPVGVDSNLETLLDTLPGDVGPDAQERHVTWAIVASAPLDVTVKLDARFVEHVRDRLLALRGRSPTTWSDADRLLVGLLDELLERELGPDVDRKLMRDNPEAAGSFGGISEHPGWWRRAMLRDKLRILALVTVTGAAAWVAEVPYDGRQFLRLNALLQMWTSPLLAHYLPALHDLLNAGPRPGSRARPAFIAAWIELIHTLIELDPQLRRLGLVEGALQVVKDLSSRLRPRTGFGDPQGLMPAQMPTQLTAAAQGLRDLVGSRTPAIPGTPAWNVLVGLRGMNLRPDIRELLDVLERVWVETGSQEAGNAAARAHQRAKARELLGHDPVDARATAPAPLTTELDGQRVTVYVSDDIIEIAHIGHDMKPHDGPLESCLDCVGGHAALHVQDYLHLRIGVILVVRTLPDGNTEILGAAPMFLTDSGLVALDAAASREGWDARPALKEYLHLWAQNVPRVYGPSELVWTPRASTEWMGLPSDAPQMRVRLVLEPDGNPELASDLTGAVSLPHVVEQDMTVWTRRADPDMGMNPDAAVHSAAGHSTGQGAAEQDRGREEADTDESSTAELRVTRPEDPHSAARPRAPPPWLRGIRDLLRRLGSAVAAAFERIHRLSWAFPAPLDGLLLVALVVAVGGIWIDPGPVSGSAAAVVLFGRASLRQLLCAALNAVGELQEAPDAREGGALAIHDDLNEEDRSAVLSIAPGLPHNRFVPASHPALRGVSSKSLSIRVWDPERVRRGFNDIGRVHLLGKLIAFSFRAGEKVHIAFLGPVLREVLDHIQAGRLPADWLRQLIYYEVHFRILLKVRAYNGMSREDFAKWMLLDRLLSARGMLLTGEPAEWWRLYHDERLSLERVAGITGIPTSTVETEFIRHGLWLRPDEPEPTFTIVQRDAPPAPATADRAGDGTSARTRRELGRKLVDLLDRRAEVVARTGAGGVVGRDVQEKLARIDAQIDELPMPRIVVDAYRIHRGYEGQPLPMDMVGLRLGASFLSVRFDEWGLPVMSVSRWHATAEQRLAAASARAPTDGGTDSGSIPEDLPEDVARIWELYGLGLDVADVATLTGGTATGVTRALRRHQLPLRLAAETRRLRREADDAVVADHVEPVAALWRAGHDPSEIAAELGIDLRLVYLALQPGIPSELFRERYSTRGLGGAPHRQGGAIAIDPDTGQPLRLTDDEYLAVLQAIHGRSAYAVQLAPGHPRFRRIDANGRFAELGTRYYEVAGLTEAINRHLPRGNRRIRVLMFTAPDFDGQRAVFADRQQSERQSWAPESARRLMNDREDARVRHPQWSEDRIQAMPLPAPSVLARLTGRTPPRHGTRWREADGTPVLAADFTGGVSLPHVPGTSIGAGAAGPGTAGQGAGQGAAGEQDRSGRAEATGEGSTAELRVTRSDDAHPAVQPRAPPWLRVMVDLLLPLLSFLRLVVAALVAAVVLLLADHIAAAIPAVAAMGVFALPFWSRSITDEQALGAPSAEATTPAGESIRRETERGSPAPLAAAPALILAPETGGLTGPSWVQVAAVSIVAGTTLTAVALTALLTDAPQTALTRQVEKERRYGQHGYGALASLTPRLRRVAYQAFTAVYDAARRPEWNGRAVENGGRAELWNPDPADVRVALELRGATPEDVAKVLQAWAFSWLDPDGVLVTAMFTDRQEELERLGQLERVREHEDADVNARFPSQEAHDLDVERVHGAIRDAQAESPGAVLARLGELPAGWDAPRERPQLRGDADGRVVAVIDVRTGEPVVDPRTGKEVALDDERLSALAEIVQSRRWAMRELDPQGAEYPLVPSLGMVDLGRIYAVPGLLRDQHDRLGGVVVPMYVGTDPVPSRRPALFLDPVVIDWLSGRDEADRWVMADRARALLQGVPEAEVTEIPLPEAPVLRLLTAPPTAQGWPDRTGDLVAEAERMAAVAGEWLKEGRRDLVLPALRTALEIRNELHRRDEQEFALPDDIVVPDSPAALTDPGSAEDASTDGRALRERLELIDWEIEEIRAALRDGPASHTAGAAPSADTVPMGIALPLGAFVTLSWNGRWRGTGWVAGPGLVVTILGMFDDAAALTVSDLERTKVNGREVDGVILYGPAEYGEGTVAVERLRMLLGLLNGHDYEIADGAGTRGIPIGPVILFRVSDHDAPALESSGPGTPDLTGSTVTVVGRHVSGVHIHLDVVVVAAGSATLTLSAPTAVQILLGSPVLGADGRVIGMVEHVDEATGLVTASSAAPLSIVAPQARSRAALPLEDSLDHVETLVEEIDAALAAGESAPLGDLLRDLEQSLDDVARELGPRQSSQLDAREYDRRFQQLVGLGKQWWQLLQRAHIAPAGQDEITRARIFGDDLGRGQAIGEADGRIGPEDMSALARAALALGDPGSWRVHLFFDYEPARFAEAFRVLGRRAGPAVPRGLPPGLVDGMAQLDEPTRELLVSLTALIAQLPAPHAERVDSIRATWQETPRLRNLELLRRSLPAARDVPDQVVPALLAVRYRVTRLRAVYRWLGGGRPGAGSGAYPVLLVEPALLEGLPWPLRLAVAAVGALILFVVLAPAPLTGAGSIRGPNHLRTLLGRALVALVGAVALLLVLRDPVLAGSAGTAAAVFLPRLPLRPRGLSRGPDRQGGAVAIDPTTGAPLRLTDEEYLAVLQAIDDRAAHAVLLPPDHPRFRRIDANGRFAEIGTRYYEVGGLTQAINRRLPAGNRRIRVLMFTAPDLDGQRSVFADKQQSRRLSWAPLSVRRLLNDREDARVRRPEWSEDRIQAMRLPPPSELVRLTGQGPRRLGMTWRTRGDALPEEARVVATTRVSPEQWEALQDVLPALIDHMRWDHHHVVDGLPVLLLDTDAAAKTLERAGLLAWVVDELIAMRWDDPRIKAVRFGAIVVPTRRKGRVSEHLRARPSPLPPGWWAGLVRELSASERDFEPAAVEKAVSDWRDAEASREALDRLQAVFDGVAEAEQLLDRESLRSVLAVLRSAMVELHDVEAWARRSSSSPARADRRVQTEIRLARIEVEELVISLLAMGAADPLVPVVEVEVQARDQPMWLEELAAATRVPSAIVEAAARAHSSLVVWPEGSGLRVGRLDPGPSSRGWQLVRRALLVIAIVLGVLVLVGVLVLGADARGVGAPLEAVAHMGGPAPLLAVGLALGFGRFPLTSGVELGDTGGGPGGAIAVRMLTADSARFPSARSVPLQGWHRRGVLSWIAERLDRAERLAMDHPDYVRADSHGRWREHGVRLFAMPGLRDAPAEFAPDLRILMFVVPDADGALAVFVDPVVLAELVTLRVFERALLAERELVRILHPQRPEREVQAMALPHPTVLGRLATVAPLGFRRNGLSVRALEGVSDVEKLGVRWVQGGRAKVASATEAGQPVVLKQPSGSPRRWFDSLVASRQPRAEGHRAVASELVATVSPVVWGAGNLVGRGEVVEVAPFLRGRPFVPADLHDPLIRAQMVDHLAERVLAAGDDVAEPGNLLVVGDVELYDIDFDRTPLGYGKFVDHLRLAQLRLPEAFAAVTLEELASQLAALSDRRVELLSALPNQRLRDTLADHLDWVDRVLERGTPDSLEGLLSPMPAGGPVSARDHEQDRRWGLVPMSARLLNGIDLVQLVEAGERAQVYEFILNSELPTSQRGIYGKWLATTEQTPTTNRNACASP